MHTKKLTFPAGLMFLLILTLAACKKEPAVSDHKTTSFKAEINGESWSADSCHSEILEDEDMLKFTAIGGNTTLEMNLKGITKSHFSLDLQENTLTVLRDTTVYQSIPGTDGYVQITLHDKVDHAFSGEYSATLMNDNADTLNVSGEFTFCKYDQ